MRHSYRFYSSAFSEGIDLADREQVVRILHKSAVPVFMATCIRDRGMRCYVGTDRYGSPWNLVVRAHARKCVGSDGRPYGIGDTVIDPCGDRCTVIGLSCTVRDRVRVRCNRPKLRDVTWFGLETDFRIL